MQRWNVYHGNARMTRSVSASLTGIVSNTVEAFVASVVSHCATCLALFQLPQWHSMYAAAHRSQVFKRAAERVCDVLSASRAAWDQCHVRPGDGTSEPFARNPEADRAARVSERRGFGLTMRHGLGLGRWLRTPRFARAEALGRMHYCGSVNGKRAHGALRCARRAQQVGDSERAAQVWAALRIPRGGHADGPLVSGRR